MAHNPPAKTPSVDLRERLYLPELIKGLAVTTRHFLRNLFGERDTNPSVVDREGVSLVSTVQYPEERVPYPPGYRGLHRLVPREDGKPRCVACYMCATVCPAQCIYIEAGEYESNDAASESRVIEKYPTKFVIDELRCIVCGLCVDACPKDAIRMDTYTHTPSEYTRKGFLHLYDANNRPEGGEAPHQLLHGQPVSHPSDPWYKRTDSQAPEHEHKEAHTRIGEGAHHQGRVEVDTHNPVPVTRFFK